MSSSKHTILIVDDEDFNRDILTEYLEEAGYRVLAAENALRAMYLIAAHREIELVLLDRMMPGMDGIEVLKRMKADPQTREVPVIMQTAAASTSQIIEGIEAGAFYYLTKPYHKSLLLSLTEAARADHRKRLATRAVLEQQIQVMGRLERARFSFRTLDEAWNLAHFLAGPGAYPEPLAFGLNELMVNAVEHGNLEITYEQKGELLLHGCWSDEVERRLGLPEYRHRRAVIEVESTTEGQTFTVRDQGKGFAWQDYLELAPERATHPHGRGIALSTRLSFSSLVYQGVGNVVVCTPYIEAPAGDVPAASPPA
jgi:CheY-like chemotaxis protein